jgi:uridine kinase
MINILEELLATKPRVGEVTFIAIDGHGGSGKSSLAKLLSQKLDAKVIRTDDFASWDNTLDWWPVVIERVFDPIIGGTKLLSYQPTSWWADHHPEAIFDQPVTNLMILEGLSSSRKEFEDYISFSIFVETPKDTCLVRGVERDVGNGKDKDELTLLWEKWLAEEDVYLSNHNPKAKADLVIDGTKPFQDQISFCS